MKTLLKVMVGGVLLLAGAAGVFYVGWLIPPDAHDVCDNLAELMKAEGEYMGILAHQKCVTRMETPPEFGKMPWVAQLKCIESAESLDEADACGRG